MYIPHTKPDEIYHFGIKERSGRYPWGSGDRPYQRFEKPKISPEERAERSRKRAETAKKVAKSIGNLVLKSALTGATVATKVVCSSAITSATLVGIAAAGYNAITSPQMSSILDQLAIKAGEFVYDRYIRKGMNYADNNLDELLEIGEYYLKTL